MADEGNPISRRRWLGAGAALGAAGVLAPAALQAADKPPPRFTGLKPLYPAPATRTQRYTDATPPPFAARVLNKAGYGPRPGDVAAFEALGGDDGQRLGAWLDEQLYPDELQDTELNARLDPLKAEGLEYDRVDSSALDLWQIARDADYQVRNRPVWQMECLALLRAVYSRWQLREVLCDFWFNHFNIYGRDFPACGMLPEYDRQLRAHLFGRFEDMLLANTRTASMLYYLDNYANTWPRPNENYAREVLELHTLGAVENYYGAVEPASVGNNAKGQRAGYTEIDVFQFAKALTGWGVADGRSNALDTGEFLFRANQHYSFSEGDIEVMDITITAPGGGESDVTQIVSYLARHYGTARYIAWKLCTRLVEDEPAEALVASTADVFYDNRDDPEQLRLVYRHVIESNDFQAAWGRKVKRPVETVVAAIRAADMDFTIRIGDGASNTLTNRLRSTSHYPFYYDAPTGYPDERAQWQGSGPLVLTWRTISRLLREYPEVNLAEQTNTALPVADDRTPRTLVDTWMDRALGYALDPAVSQKIVDFVVGRVAGVGENDPLDLDVNTADTGENSTWQKLVRGVVGLVLMAPDAMRR